MKYTKLKKLIARVPDIKLRNQMLDCLVEPKVFQHFLADTQMTSHEAGKLGIKWNPYISDEEYFSLVEKWKVRPKEYRRSDIAKAIGITQRTLLYGGWLPHRQVLFSEREFHHYVQLGKKKHAKHLRPEGSMRLSEVAASYGILECTLRLWQGQGTIAKQSWYSPSEAEEIGKLIASKRLNSMSGEQVAKSVGCSRVWLTARFKPDVTIENQQHKRYSLELVQTIKEAYECRKK